MVEDELLAHRALWRTCLTLGVFTIVALAVSTSELETVFGQSAADIIVATGVIALIALIAVAWLKLAHVRNELTSVRWHLELADHERNQYH